MPMKPQLPSPVLALLVLASLAASSPSSPGSPVFLHPAQYASPSGEYVFKVDPGDRRGRGAGHHRLLRKGVEVWSRSLPVTLWKAVVTDLGSVGGYAYSEEGSGHDRLRRFHVVILDPEGGIVLNETTDQVWGRSPDSPREPYAHGLVAHSGLDLLHVQIVAPDVLGGSRWASYRLSTGESAPPLVPITPIDTAPEELVGCRQLYPLPGTPLYVVEWSHQVRCPEIDNYHFELGAIYSLMKADGESVWMVKRPGDFTDPDATKTSYDFMQRIRRQGVILDVHDSGRFSLWFVRDEAKVEFEALPSESAPRGWSVTEAKRSPRQLSNLEPTLPKIELPLVMSAKLVPVLKETDEGATYPPSLELESPQSAVIDHLGRIVVRDAKNGGVFVFDDLGECLFICSPKASDPKEMRIPSPGHLPVDDRGNVYVPWDTKGSAHIRYDDRGHRIGAFELGGDFVHFVPGSSRRWIGSNYGGYLQLVESDGREVAVVDRRSDRKWIRWLTDFDVLPDGSLVILDPIPFQVDEVAVIAFFDADGTPKSTVPIPPHAGMDLAATADWVAVGGGPDRTLLRRHDQTLFSFDPDVEKGDRTTWEYGFSPDGKELWAVEVDRLRLYRFALPAR
jgi:hypothetical protein